MANDVALSKASSCWSKGLPEERIMPSSGRAWWEIPPTLLDSLPKKENHYQAEIFYPHGLIADKVRLSGKFRCVPLLSEFSAIFLNYGYSYGTHRTTGYL
jgi:hypothetical protein